MGRTFKIYSLSNFRVYNTVLFKHFLKVSALLRYNWHIKLFDYNTVLLTVIPMLYIRSPEFIHQITGNLYPFHQYLPKSPISEPPATTILVSVFMSLAVLDSTYKWHHTVFVFNCLQQCTEVLLAVWVDFSQKNLWETSVTPSVWPYSMYW